MSVAKINGKTVGIKAEFSGGVLIGTTADITPEQVKAAVDVGRTIALTHTDTSYGTQVFSSFDIVSTAAGYTVNGEMAYGTSSDAFMLFSLSGNVTTGAWTFSARSVPTIEGIPAATSQLENDSGFLTLDTLPKYEGVVSE